MVTRRGYIYESRLLATCIYENVGQYFHICSQIETVFNILIFINGRHFEVTPAFLSEVIREVEYTSKVAMRISDIVSFWSML